MRLFGLALLLVLLAAAPPAQPSKYVVTWAMESAVYPANGSGHDFLAVFDISDGHFGHLAAMVPVPVRAQMAHHANYEMPPNHRLFANDFMAGRSYVFDLTDPLKPQVAAAFARAGPYTNPHSFGYLSNGHTLATYQFKGSGDHAAGALVELDAAGGVVRTSDAAAPSVDSFVRPYSVLALESIDRVVTTSADMMPSTISSHVVQIWRLSDLKLLKTVVLPAPAAFHGAAGEDAVEARTLGDDKTVLVVTAKCGLYRLNGLAGEHPSAEMVYDFGYRSCSGVPVVVGNYWLQPSLSGHCITSLDVSNPAHPVESGRLFLGNSAHPHWLAREPGSNRFLITGFGSLLTRITFATVDLHDGKLDISPESIDLDRAWPDGWHGPAIPHATLFD
jgi:hypothetical protein